MPSRGKFLRVIPWFYPALTSTSTPAIRQCRNDWLFYTGQYNLAQSMRGSSFLTPRYYYILKERGRLITIINLEILQTGHSQMNSDDFILQWRQKRSRQPPESRQVWSLTWLYPLSVPRECLNVGFIGHLPMNRREILSTYLPSITLIEHSATSEVEIRCEPIRC